MSTSSFKNFLHGLALFLILVFGFEGMVAQIPEEIYTDVINQAGLRIKYDRALTPGPLDIIVLGDCFPFAAIIPSVLDKELNVHSFNFATNRVKTYMVNYLLLKMILEHSKKNPGLIIVGVHPTSLYYPLEMDFKYLKERILFYIDPSPDLLHELPESLQARVLFHKLLTQIPSMKRQYILRKNWPELMADYDPRKSLIMTKSITEERGYFNEDLVDHEPKFIINTKRPPEEAAVQPHIDHYLNKILDLARHYGVKVVLATSSYREDLARNTQYDIDFDVRYFETLQQRYPNVIGVFDMHQSVTDFDRYTDITHLDHQGAMIFSKDLARRLKGLGW